MSGFSITGTSGHCLANGCALTSGELAARIERLKAAPVPTALHWLGDRHEGTPCAQDARGCVLYFSTQDECLQFMNWLTALARKEGT